MGANWGCQNLGNSLLNTLEGGGELWWAAEGQQKPSDIFFP